MRLPQLLVFHYVQLNAHVRFIQATLQAIPEE